MALLGLVTATGLGHDGGADLGGGADGVQRDGTSLLHAGSTAARCAALPALIATRCAALSASTATRCAVLPTSTAACCAALPDLGCASLRHPAQPRLRIAASPYQALAAPRRAAPTAPCCVALPSLGCASLCRPAQPLLALAAPPCPDLATPALRCGSPGLPLDVPPCPSQCAVPIWVRQKWGRPRLSQAGACLLS